MIHNAQWCHNFPVEFFMLYHLAGTDRCLSICGVKLKKSYSNLSLKCDFTG